MKRLWIWIILLLSILVACSPDSLIPPEPVMQDGVWTGNGEGRSGTILVRITVLGHRITNIVVVSQSESSFAQDAINMAIRSALGQGDSGKTIIKTEVVMWLLWGLVGQGSPPPFKRLQVETSESSSLRNKVFLAGTPTIQPGAFTERTALVETGLPILLSTVK